MSLSTTGFILNEDKALKQRLSGLSVTDQTNAAREVKVWFRDPQKEQRETEFPYITLHFTGMERDPMREHRGRLRMPYIPDGVTVDGQANTTAIMPEYPIPVNLNYAVVTHCRNPMHDRQLNFNLLGVDYIPWRFGWLDIPEDNTIRRLDLMNVVSNDYYDQNGKIIFRKVYQVVVSSEILTGQITQVQQATEVVLTTLSTSVEQNNAYHQSQP